MKHLLPALALVGLAAASPLRTQVLAPVHGDVHSEAADERVKDSYIVVLRDGVDLAETSSHHSFARRSVSESSSRKRSSIPARFGHIYNLVAHAGERGFNGYSVHGIDEHTLDAIRAQPEVEYVERDSLVWTQDVPRGVEDDEHIEAADVTTQKNAPWGLARISHRDPLSLSTFQKYVYNTEGGEGVDAYIIDTGINVNHVEFEGRAHWGKTIPQNDQDIDGNGHGTHVAGTIGSRKYGVAKKAELYAVKVLGTNGSGTMSDVVSGVVWAAEQALKKAKAAEAEVATNGKTAHKGSVANMSLGGGKSPALDRAVNRAVESGLHFAVAAGNDNKDACNYSPAAADKAVTVGASTVWDERAYFSNWGKCVDVFAPGLNILSTWNTGNYSTNTISGTSMASPHTAGVLAYLLSLHGSKLDLTTLEPIPTSRKLVESFPIFAVQSTLRGLDAVLPGWLSSYFPSPKQALSAPAPGPISPAILKKTLIELSNRGVLSDVGVESPNLLIFNNATSSSK